MEMARVEPRVQLLDRLALAGAVDARDHDDRGEASKLDQFELRVEQRLAKLGLLGLVDVLVDDVRQRRRFEHRGGEARRIDPPRPAKLPVKRPPSLSWTSTSRAPGRSGTKEKRIEGFSLRLMSASTERTGRAS